MSVLMEAKRREQSAERKRSGEREPSGYQLNAAELMRGCRWAAFEATRRLPRVSEDERDALAQLVALRVLEGGAERGEAGKRYLLRVANTLRERNGEEWRDVAAEYRESRERKRGESPSTFQLEGASEGGWLALALARESERQNAERPAALPEDLREIARAMAESESELPAEREALYAALLAKLPDPKTGNAPNGVSIAKLLGVSHAAARKRVSRGSALWRERYSRGELARLIRATGAALGAESVSERERAERYLIESARRAVEQVQAERKRSGAPRSRSWSPVTARATRRNQRAAMRTGRWGKVAERRATRRSCSPVWLGAAMRAGERADAMEALRVKVAERRAARVTNA